MEIRRDWEISHVWTCFKEAGRFFCHFRKVLRKCIECIGKFLVHFKEIWNFLEKVVYFGQILSHFNAHFLKCLMISQVSHVCLLTKHSEIKAPHEKPTFCICKNKGADQLRSNWGADQHLCFPYMDSTYCILYFLYLKLSASSHFLSLYSSVCVEPVQNHIDDFLLRLRHKCRPLDAVCMMWLIFSLSRPSIPALLSFRDSLFTRALSETGKQNKSKHCLS